MTEQLTLNRLPDDELLRRLSELLRDSRCTESDLVAHIAEVDKRRLYAREASPSMFSYCTRVLHLSGSEAYLRIRAARAARRHRVLLEMLADGRLHLAGIAMLAPYLTRENRDAILSRATHRSKREIDELIAELFPRPDVPSLIRKLPDRAGRTPPATQASDPALVERPVVTHGTLAGGFPLGVPAGVAGHALPVAGPPEVPAAAAHVPDEAATAVATVPELRPDTVPARDVSRSVVEPLALSRYKVQFTATAELKDKLERLQALLRSEVPDGDLGRVIDRAVSEKLERLEARRFARTIVGGRSRTTSSTSRAVPPANGNPRSVRQSVSQSVPQSVRQSTPHSQPQSTPQSTPVSTPQSRPEPAPRGSQQTSRPASSNNPARTHGHGRRATTRRITITTRYIPAAIRRAVYERDGGRCRYTDEAGRRCPERHRLEYHHVYPFGMGGGHTVDNVLLMCRANNLYLAEHDYGREAIAAYCSPGPEDDPAPATPALASGRPSSSGRPCWFGTRRSHDEFATSGTD